MSKKQYFLVIDVEGTRSQKVYDIGFVITDRNGNIYQEFSGVVAEIFFGWREEMKTSYYSKKIPKYLDNIGNLQTNVFSFEYIRQQVFTAIQQYEITAICAYNIQYDKNALNKTLSLLTNGSETEYFPAETIFYDIWGMACQVLCIQKHYVKLAIQENWVTNSGNMQTSAEFVYRYITKDTTFQEEHTGLADCLIEVSIFVKCIKQHKTMTRTIIGNPWRLAQSKYREVLNTL